MASRRFRIGLHEVHLVRRRDVSRVTSEDQARSLSRWIVESTAPGDLQQLYGSGETPDEEQLARALSSGEIVLVRVANVVVRSAFDRALDAGGFQSMPPDVGRRGQRLGERARPTLHFAYELGFEVQEIRHMFRSPEIALAIADLEEAKYPKPIRKVGP